MIPIVTPAEMAAIDTAAPEPVEVLIRQAGFALAKTALQILDGSYGRRVTVIAGKGNNGADGRAAANYLSQKGVRVAIVDAAKPPAILPPAHLTIDAAYGTGLHKPYHPEAPPALLQPALLQHPTRPAPILAADISSGVHGLTGELIGTPWQATQTLTFGALKPGLLLHPGAQYCGKIALETLGLDTSQATAHLVTEAAVASWLPKRPPDAHKWHTACWIIAGSPNMFGAASLAASAALRGGSGYVRLSIPSYSGSSYKPSEAVSHPLPASDWWQHINQQDLSRFKVMLVGPGLGTDAATTAAIKDLAAKTPLTLILDGDGLTALGQNAAAVLQERQAPTILTPHDGEYRSLTGTSPGSDRFAAARHLATSTGATVLLKGPCTVVAQPDGTALAVNNGDARLATAGTGDVLAGLICGLASAAVSPMQAAASAGWLHGQAAQALPAAPIVAADLLSTLPLIWQKTAFAQTTRPSWQSAL